MDQQIQAATGCNQGGSGCIGGCKLRRRLTPDTLPLEAFHAIQKVQYAWVTCPSIAGPVDLEGDLGGASCM
jgi:hypothetical protein